MNKEDFDRHNCKELVFYNNFDENTYGKYYFLLGHSITTFRFIDQWTKELFPYLEGLQNGTEKIDDWNSLPWGGTICFRSDHVMILDNSLEQNGRPLPGLKNEKGENYLNVEGEWLLDTDFIEKNYTEYVKVPVPTFIYYSKKWLDILISEAPA